MKKTILKGGLLVVLMSMIVACNDTNKLVVPDPTPEVDPTSTVEKDSEGVTVLIDYEDVETGEITRAVTGDRNYRFTPYGLGGEVQMEGTGWHLADFNTGNVDVNTIFYSVQNVVFKGWSWRYAEDPKGTHRDSKGNSQSDFNKLPILQSSSGLQKLGSTNFTCKYQPGTENRVYVKVNYLKSAVPVKRLVVRDLNPLGSYSDWAELAGWSSDVPAITHQPRIASDMLSVLNTFRSEFGREIASSGETQRLFDQIETVLMYISEGSQGWSTLLQDFSALEDSYLLKYPNLSKSSFISEAQSLLVKNRFPFEAISIVSRESNRPLFLSLISKYENNNFNQTPDTQKKRREIAAKAKQMNTLFINMNNTVVNWKNNICEELY